MRIWIHTHKASECELIVGIPVGICIQKRCIREQANCRVFSGDWMNNLGIRVRANSRCLYSQRFTGDLIHKPGIRYCAYSRSFSKDLDSELWVTDMICIHERGIQGRADSMGFTAYLFSQVPHRRTS